MGLLIGKITSICIGKPIKQQICHSNKCLAAIGEQEQAILEKNKNLFGAIVEENLFGDQERKIKGHQSRRRRDRTRVLMNTCCTQDDETRSVES